MFLLPSLVELTKELNDRVTLFMVLVVWQLIGMPHCVQATANSRSSSLVAAINLDKKQEEKRMKLASCDLANRMNAVI